MALINLVNDKLDEEDRKRKVLFGGIRRLIRRVWIFSKATGKLIASL